MQSFQNHFLVATPQMQDSYFRRTVTYICEHDDQGAMGVIINQPVDMSLRELIEQVDADNIHTPTGVVFSGGPVATDRGFVLHSPQPGWKSSLQISKDLMITTSADILSTLGTADEPSKYIVTLGYAGWTAGQLEQELADNCWITVPADADIVFDMPVEDRWQQAMKRIGVDVWNLSSDVGHA